MSFIYLPIADMPVSPIIILGLAFIVGFLSRLFGLGGGFIATPLLILVNIPPAVAVGSQTAYLATVSVAGSMGHWRRRSADFRLCGVLAAGGLAGAALGVLWHGGLDRSGHLMAVLSVAYALLLGAIGLLLLNETLQTLRPKSRKHGETRKLHRHIWLHGLPLKMRFPASRLYISALPPLFIGILGGLLAAMLGTAGGALLVPALIYLLGVPTALVSGTVLVMIAVITCAGAFLHAWLNQSVDLVLVVLLLAGALAGNLIGRRAKQWLGGKWVRAMFGLFALVLGGVMATNVVTTPASELEVIIERGP